MIMKKLLLTIFATGLIASLAACSSSNSDTSAEGTSDNTTAAETSQAKTPDDGSAVSATFMAYDTDGTLQSSDKWIGKQPVVINFWGTWCPPCRKEIPDMVKVYNEYAGKNIEMIGLAVNDTPEKVVTFANQNKMNWVLLMADESVVAEFAPIRGVPTTVFLDHTGKEVHRFVGPISYEQLKQAFDALLDIQAQAQKS